MASIIIWKHNGGFHLPSIWVLGPLGMYCMYFTTIIPSVMVCEVMQDFYHQQ